jgi:phenylacetic acid degradation operon negative regulatory protein
MLSNVNVLDFESLLGRERRPTAKRLILSLLSQPRMATLSLRQLVAWGELLGQKPAAIRVTAGRLVKEGLLETVSRGVYTIGPNGLVLRNKASEWMTALDQIRDWKGGWICVHTAHLGKANRRNVRKRERAFRLVGFKELVDGVWIRPDNLTYTPTQIYVELCQLGLEPDAVLLRSDVIEHSRSESPLDLWGSDTLNASYEKGVELLQHSEQRLRQQDLRTVTRETFLIGEQVIRQINADPLLPTDYVDASKRKKLVHAMKRYSKFCHPQWAQFLAQSE